MVNKHRGSRFDDFLREEGILEKCTETAKKRLTKNRPKIPNANFRKVLKKLTEVVMARKELAVKKRLDAIPPEIMKIAMKEFERRGKISIRFLTNTLRRTQSEACDIIAKLFFAT
jgi:hypothetical protein